MTLEQALAGSATEIAYRDSGERIHGRMLHLAAREDGFERALCGKRRENPLEPNAQGEVCVVCAGLYRDRYGRDWSCLATS